MNSNAKHNKGDYLHRLSYTRRERWVGLFVFSAFIFFLFFFVISIKNQHLFEQRIPFYIHVNSSEGISQGIVVNALGTEVGRVSALHLIKGQKIRVTIEVYQGRRTLIREGARAIVNRLTGINNALIEIESDSVEAPVLDAGSIIPVEETPSLNDLLMGIASLIQTADKQDLLTKFENILPKLEHTIENIHIIIDQIATGDGVVGAAVFDQGVEQDLRQVVKSGAQILSEAEGIIEVAKQRLVQLDPIINGAGQIVNDVQGATQSLPDMLTELKQIITQTNTALTLINKELNDLPGVALDARRTLSKTEILLDSVQDTWPLSTAKEAGAVDQLIPAHSGYE